MYFKSYEFNQIPSILISFNEIGKNYCQLQFFIDYNDHSVHPIRQRTKRLNSLHTLLIQLYDFLAPLASIFFTHKYEAILCTNKFKQKFQKSEFWFHVNYKKSFMKLGQKNLSNKVTDNIKMSALIFNIVRIVISDP